MAKTPGFLAIDEIERVDILAEKRTFLRIVKKLCATFCLAFAFAVAPAHATLPAGYTELEYIESTGTQYIDTGLTINSGVITGTAVFGMPETLQVSDTYGVIFGYNSNMQAGYRTNGVAINGATATDTVFYAPNQQYTVQAVFTTASGGGAYYVDGVNTYLNRATNVDVNILLFASSSTAQHAAFGRMYSFVAERNNSVIMNLVPARRNSDNVIGMYDTVSDTFFTNAGTGEFIAGPLANPIKVATTAYSNTAFSSVQTALNNTIATIKTVVADTINQAAAVQQIASGKQTRPSSECPTGKTCLLIEDANGEPHWYEIIERAPGIVPTNSGYTQVEYLQSDGGQYIDTGIRATANTKVEAVIGRNTQLISGNNGIFGASYFGCRWESADVFRCGFGTQDWGSTSVTQLDKNTVNFENNNFKYNSQTLSVRKGSLFGAANILLFAMSSDAKSATTMYKITIYNNDTLVRDFVPARRNSDDVLGMYDTVSGTFFTNAGTGTFTTASTEQ